MAEARFVPSIYPHGDAHPRCPNLVLSNTGLETVLRGRTLLACFEAIPAFKSSEEHQRFHERNSTRAMSGAWVFCADCNDILEGTLSYNGDLLSQALLNPTQTLDFLVEQVLRPVKPLPISRIKAQPPESIIPFRTPQVFCLTLDRVSAPLPWPRPSPARFTLLDIELSSFLW